MRKNTTLQESVLNVNHKGAWINYNRIWFYNRITGEIVKPVKLKRKYWQWNKEDSITREETSLELRKYILKRFGINIVSNKHAQQVLSKYQKLNETGYV